MNPAQKVCCTEMGTYTYEMVASTWLITGLPRYTDKISSVSELDFLEAIGGRSSTWPEVEVKGYDILTTHHTVVPFM